jgi:hypothetical protein
MKRRTAPKGRPTSAPITLAHAVADAGARSTRILEAVEDRDLSFAEIALRDLVGDLMSLIASEPSSVSWSGAHCPRCGLDCRWPGLLERHLAIVHHQVADAA